MRTPATYRVDVRVLAFGEHHELVASQVAGVDLSAAEYDALDTAQLMERFVLPATVAAKQVVDAQIRGDA